MSRFVRFMSLISKNKLICSCGFFLFGGNSTFFGLISGTKFAHADFPFEYLEDAIFLTSKNLFDYSTSGPTDNVVTIAFRIKLRVLVDILCAGVMEESIELCISLSRCVMS